MLYWVGIWRKRVDWGEAIGLYCTGMDTNCWIGYGVAIVGKVGKLLVLT